MHNYFFGVALVIFALPALIFWAVQLGSLMGRRDEEFPGRYDKLMWGLIVFFGGLIGATVYYFAKPRWLSPSARKFGLGGTGAPDADLRFPSLDENATQDGETNVLRNQSDSV
ncbi:MAG: hypothetical protein WD069_21765 [Planctomycetales bacterium]